MLPLIDLSDAINFVLQKLSDPINFVLQKLSDPIHIAKQFCSDHKNYPKSTISNIQTAMSFRLNIGTLN